MPIHDKTVARHKMGTRAKVGIHMHTEVNTVSHKYTQFHWHDGQEQEES